MITILAALFSAAATGWVTHHLARKRDIENREKAASEARQQERRELIGLLRLLDIEIGKNQEQIRWFKLSSQWIVKAPEYSLSYKVWEDVRVRLSQLVRNDDLLADVAKFYGNVEGVDNFRMLSNRPEAETIRIISEQLPIVEELAEISRTHIRDVGVPNAMEGTLLDSVNPPDP